MPLHRTFLPVVLLLAVFIAGGALAEAPGDKDPPAAARHPGPARWLMLPAELRSWRNLRDASEEPAFFDEFWRRRDPDPAAEGNPLQQLFSLRSAEADALFDGESAHGSMTARGRAYLLLGPPSSISQAYRRMPSLGPAAARQGADLRTQPLLVETWSWRPEDLSPGVRRLLKKKDWKIALAVQFKVDVGRYTLLEGDDLLRLAARSWLREGVAE